MPLTTLIRSSSHCNSDIRLPPFQICCCARGVRRPIRLQKHGECSMLYTLALAAKSCYGPKEAAQICVCSSRQSPGTRRCREPLSFCSLTFALFILLHPSIFMQD